MTAPSPGEPTPRSRSCDVAAAALLVGAQFVLLGLVVALPDRTDWPVPPWLPATAEVAGLAGLLLAAVAAGTLRRGLTPSPLPNRHTTLHTGGLYRYVRHPVYSGLLLFAAARVAGSGSLHQLALFAALAGLLTAKAGWEETHLRRRFPGYVAYARATPRLVPRLRRSRSGAAGELALGGAEQDLRPAGGRVHGDDAVVAGVRDQDPAAVPGDRLRLAERGGPAEVGGQ